MPRKLPAILSADEVARFLEAVPSLKARAALTTAYAAGLRVSEVVSLKVGDVDSDRLLIQVRHGKGAKDRTDVVGPTARYLTHLLAPDAANRLAFPGTERRTYKRDRSACGVPVPDKAAGLTKKVSARACQKFCA